MIDTEQAFLGAIVANIDDDLPRLIYADWLLENGQDHRSEFIQVQVARARRPAWDPSQVHLRLREKELLSLYGEKWLAELPKVDGMTWEGFRRGIVAEVSFASFEAMRAKTHECREMAPIEAVTVHWPRRNELRTKMWPIAELRELTLTGRPYDVETTRLAESPQLSTLRKLDVLGLDVSDLNRLTASPHLGKLKSLRLTSNGVGTAGVNALVQSSTFQSLEALDLSGPGYHEHYYDDPIINDIGMAALATWPGLANVHTMTLSGSDIRPAGLRALLHSPQAKSLKRLSVRGGRLDGQAMAEFGSSRSTLRFESLNLGENVIGDAGAEALAVADCLSELKSLRIDRCEIGHSGSRRFAQNAKFLDGLYCLDIGYNHFGYDGLQALLERKPKLLHTLRIRDNDLNDTGVGLLAKSPSTDGFLELDLRRNGLSQAAFQALEATVGLKVLIVLRLADNKVPEQIARNFAATPLAKRLMELELDGVSKSKSSRWQSTVENESIFDDGQRWNYDNGWED